MEKRKKIIALLLLYTMLFTEHINAKSIFGVKYYDDYDKKPNIPYASYLDKDIFIVNSQENILNHDDDDIIVIDKRDSFDPDMQIIDSYRINNLIEMRKILLILKEYEREYPSLWNRTVLSMQYEWILHNIAYYIGFFRNNAKDVNLNNADESKLIPGLGK